MSPDTDISANEPYFVEQGFFRELKNEPYFVDQGFSGEEKSKSTWATKFYKLQR